MASRHIRLRWAVTAALLALHCAPVQRREERIEVAVGGMYGRAGYVDRGCDGEVLSERHRQLGFEASIRHEGAEGLLLGGRAFAAQDELTESRGFEPIATASPDWIVGAGGWVGHDWASVGVGGGFHVVHAVDANALFLPHLRLKLGNMQRIWFETALGPDDPLLFVNIYSGAVGLRGDRFRLRFGMTVGGRLLVSHQPDDVTTDGRTFDRGRELRLGVGDGAGGPFGDVEVDLPGHLGLGAGFFYGDDAPAGRLSLRYRW